VFRAPGIQPEHGFSRFDLEHRPFLDHGPVISPYLYAPYDGYGLYDPGDPSYAFCDRYSQYYDPRYCY
jgi:hypothetical protein